MRNFPGLIKNKMEFPEVIKKVEFPGVLVLGLKISKRCDNKILWSFQEWKKLWEGKVLDSSNAPQSSCLFFSEIAHC